MFVAEHVPEKRIGFACGTLIVGSVLMAASSYTFFHVATTAPTYLFSAY
ncbi:hypothetical protein ACZ87_01426 [Candidatus Erwinia dacicola]|uniref:Uncharacterized protein n=1 Tax=Candidatus Erwinia dacicola TaxID=252393 RepID=A0A328TN09_9GAMM|nr:hypothetical protein ACZ87_01426 [Candidatus Erwinia dacicola]